MIHPTITAACIPNRLQISLRCEYTHYLKAFTQLSYNINSQEIVYMINNSAWGVKAQQHGSKWWHESSVNCMIHRKISMHHKQTSTFLKMWTHPQPESVHTTFIIQFENCVLVIMVCTTTTAWISIVVRRITKVIHPKTSQTSSSPAPISAPYLTPLKLRVWAVNFCFRQGIYSYQISPDRQHSFYPIPTDNKYI